MLCDTVFTRTKKIVWLLLQQISSKSAAKSPALVASAVNLRDRRTGPRKRPHWSGAPVPPVLSGRDQVSPTPFNDKFAPADECRCRVNTIRVWRLRGCRRRKSSLGIPPSARSVRIIHHLHADANFGGQPRGSACL
jgi:hypothetical protein